MHDKSSESSTDPSNLIRAGANRMTRRRMLKYSTSMAAMAFAASFMPPNVRRALAQEPPKRRPSFKDIAPSWNCCGVDEIRVVRM